jgi:hypothetical protein
MLTKASLIAATALLASLIAATALLAGVIPGVTILAQRATNLLHSQAAFHKAVLLEAEGTPKNPKLPTKSAAGISTWRFVFDNQPTGGKYKSVSITARRGILGTPKGNTSVFGQDKDINTIPNMLLTRAVQLLKAKGYRRGFFAVTLRWPNYPNVNSPEYIFALVGRKIVAVDTDTGKVHLIS